MNIVSKWLRNARSVSLMQSMMPAALAVVLGNAAASLVLLALLAFVPGEYIDIMLLAFAALAVALFASWVLMRLHARRRRKKKKPPHKAPKRKATRHPDLGLGNGQ